MAKSVLTQIVPGQRINFQRLDGTNANYVAVANGGTFNINAGGTPLRLSYTPPVDVWWDVHACLGIVYKTDAVYDYMYAYYQMAVADLLGITQVFQILTQRSDVNTFGYRDMRRKFMLAAGIAYTCTVMCSCSGANWQYYQDNARCFIEGTAYAR